MSEHNPCCSSHGVDMSCERYRRTHFVEVRPCCAADAELLKAEAPEDRGPVRHNHITRDMKESGVCPSCDQLHAKYETKPLQPGEADDNVGQPPGVDVHDRGKQFPPAGEAADRVLAFVAWFGDGQVLPGGPLPDGPSLFARDLEAVAKAATAPAAGVLAFINQRPEYVAAARNTPGDVDQGDYHRWQGHMEARRQLAQTLGYTVPYERGDKTTKKDES